MEIPEIIKALRRNMVETGSLICIGCGREHNCSTHGCAIMREAADALEKPNRRVVPENVSEVVKKLWALYDKYEDAEHVVCGDAAKLLQATPENKPLTLEQLRQMDRSIVWLEQRHEFRTVLLDPDGVKLWALFGPMSAKNVLATGERIYARKPEGK